MTGRRERASGWMGRLRLAFRAFLHPQVAEHMQVLTTPSTGEESGEGTLLSGKVAFVSHAETVLGGAISLELTRQGASVVASGLGPARLRELQSGIGTEAAAFPGSLIGMEGSEGEKDLPTWLGGRKVDVLVLCPDTAPGESLEDAVARNLFQPVALARAAARSMSARGIEGVILFVSSVHQAVAFGDLGVSATDAALGMVVKEMALELAPHGIRVNGIAPGVVSELSGKVESHTLTPLGGTRIPPEAVGRTAVYLASDFYSRCTTGTVLTVDGGLSMHSYMTLHNLAP